MFKTVQVHVEGIRNNYILYYNIKIFQPELITTPQQLCKIVLNVVVQFCI